MPSRLYLKLVAAFLGVLLLVAILTVVLTRRATRLAFGTYTERSAQAWAQRLAPVLADYYQRTGSWEGIDMFLHMAEMWPRGRMGQGMMGNNGGHMTPLQTTLLGRVLAQRLVLVDANGRVVLDTQGLWEGQTAPAEAMGLGAPIRVGNTQVGTLLVLPAGVAGVVTLESEFLNAVNRAVLGAVIIASVVALILVALIVYRIIAPLRRLQQAAQAIAEGDLSQRVPVATQDEIGAVSMAFNEMATSLERAEKARRQMVADVAHELRTPLAVLQANLEAMQDGVLPMDLEQVQVLYDQVQLLNRLVADLRLLSLAESGHLTLEKQLTELFPLVQKVVGQFEAAAAQKAVRLTITAPDNLPALPLDAQRIQQVLANLLDNALRYTPEGGEIRIEITPDQNQHRIVVAVSDTGPGIPREDLSHVFERFYRADKSRARSSGGSGLGLAIVKQLVQLHGGEVHAVSPIYTDSQGRGYGTRLEFTLPF
ncbi:MAG: sensor histidine kinase [Thermanaerothrix sp.]|uniref:histidine kinase n=1 Tax=Thermanaerothrix solaris TaxID=3058434 RepID=A0ABU3NPV1_9CHLR|nr:ATP-binding protein [Thermanaerothrix sp. 4228-RoL]MDT8898874.1 ATP-binding protein [Thermanaerothrix sp. 4228-RoL]